MANKAHVYKSKSGNHNISFHHPICREGTIGKKIHRSLKVSTDGAAERLRLQMDDLLALADTPAMLPSRSQAIEDGKYDRVIIDAFYDCITPEPIDYIDLRERAMPLPEKNGTKGPTPRVLFAGPTGAGKSRIIQHLLQTTAFNFPKRGAGRTTVADGEIIVGDYDYSAVMTFYAQGEIRQIIKENILEACAFARRNREDTLKIQSKLLIDSDKRFRFNFVLGELEDTAASEADFDLDETEGESSDLGEDAAPAEPWSKLTDCFEQVVSLSDHAFAAARRGLNPTSGEDEVVVEEYWLQYVNEDQLDALVEEILEELERRLCAVTGQPSWPVLHQLASTRDMEEFFKRLRPFYQNDRRLFGTLVTPLVQGIRVRGRFPPPSCAGVNLPSWVLIDGQGLGHDQDRSSQTSRTVPPELAQKFSGADIICLVDRSVPAMTGDARILLENLIGRGYQDRIALVFTRFEDVDAPDLNLAARKGKVLEGVSTAIQSIASLPKVERIRLEQTAEAKTYLLAHLNLEGIKGKLTQLELKRLCDLFRRGGELTLPNFRPQYNEYQIADAVREQITSYRTDWSEDQLALFHWKIMEALTNWIGNAHRDGYPKRGLYPGQDLSQRLMSAVSSVLESPTWEPYEPPTDEEKSQVLNAIRIKLGDKLDEHCRVRLVSDPRIGSWLPAYKTISGPGTKRRRARSIARILEDRASLPDEGLGEFTKDIWCLIQESIAEVCSVELRS